MSAIDVTALGLASHVALGWTDIGPTGGCVAWVESRAAVTAVNVLDTTAVIAREA